MGGVALVLSGGGAKGAFQFAAEKYAREVKGYKWSVIGGVSVGALNGVLLAMEKYERLENLWNSITRDDIMTGELNFWSILKMLFGAKSIFGNKPLWELLQEEVEPDKIGIDLRIGAVSLQTGEYRQFKPSEEGFERAALASTAIPIIWAPIDVSTEYPSMVDGGVRNVSPLGDVLDTEPDEVVVINCSPREPLPLLDPLNNILEIGKRSLDIALNEIFMTDVREFTRINKNVLEASEKGVKLHNEEGKEFKYYDCKIIEPDKPLGDTLDFSRETLDNSMKAGLEKAKEVLG